MNVFTDEYNPEAAVRLRLDSFDFFVTPRYRERYERQAYEPFSSAIVRDYLRPGATFLDVGAHYGYYALLAAHAHPDVHVIAVEPVPQTFQVLQRNMEMNGVSRRTLYNLAASDKREDKLLQKTEASDSAGFYAHPRTKTLSTILVEAAVLDELLGTRPVDFIKIDVEGHELPVLAGLEKTLARNRDVLLLVELYPTLQASAGYSADTLLKKLEDLGFELYVVDDTKRTFCRLTNNRHPWHALRPFQRDAREAYANVLCVRKERALLTTFFSHSAELAGAERGLLDLVKNMQEYQALAHIVAPSEGPLTEELRQRAIAVDIVPFHWWASSKESIGPETTLRSLRAVSGYLPELERVNPHVVYTNTTVIPWGALAAFLLDKPHVWHVYEFGEKDHGLTYDLTFPETLRVISVASDRVLYCSRAVEQEFQQYIDTKKSELLYYTVRVPKELAEAPHPAVFQSPDALKLIIVGRVDPTKGQDQAVHAVLDLLEEGMPVELVLLGPHNENDPSVRALRGTLAARGALGIRFHPFARNPFPTMNQADALLMCSRCEALGRVTIEAMLLGKAVIGANTGGTPELITNGVTGLLYQYGDIEDLKRAIRQLAADRALRARLGAAARAFAERQFAQNAAAQRTADLCRELASPRAAASRFSATGAALRELLARYTAQQHETEATLAAHAELIAGYSQQLHDMLTSQSWRMTAPLRTLKRLARERPES